MRLPRATLLILVLLSIADSAFAGDRVEWVAVDGADHYMVDVRRAGETVLETRSDENWIPLFLPAGEYEFRVRAMNAFGKESSRSEWSPLTILAPSIPFAISLLPGEIHEGTESEFRARVSGFIPEDGEKPGSSFRLETEDEKPIDLEVTGFEHSEGWTEIALSAGRRKPGIGSWTLVMTNPDGRENRMEEALEVLDNLKPRIKSVSPGEIAAGLSHNSLTLEISGLEEEAEIRFHGPSQVQPALLARPEDGILEYSLNLLNATPGWYSVSVRNPSGGEAVKERAFEILPRPLTEEELAAQYALKVDDKEPLVLPDHPRSVFFGWSMAIPVGETRTFYKTDFVGLTVGYAQMFHNDFFRKLYWLRGLGWDFTWSYTNHQTAYPILDIDLNRFHFLLGLHYVTPFEFPVNLMLRMSAGVGISFYTSPDISRGVEFVDDTSLEDLGSLDYVMRFGGGARISIGSRWYIDVACDVSATFYLSRTAWSVLPKLEGGFRL